tara:strand:- start:140 stop:451 length:312 start_codon:yes stop_codon:yes gene_type:complete
MSERGKENTREKSERRTQRHGSVKELLSRLQTVSGQQTRVRLRGQSREGEERPTRQAITVQSTPVRKSRDVQKDALRIDPIGPEEARVGLIAQEGDNPLLKKF